MNAKTKKVLAIIGNTALWLFVIFAVCITAVVLSSANNENGVASFNGKSYINIKTDSMNPAFKAGDMIVIKLLVDQEKANLKENDVITYYTDLDNNGTKELNTHRIVERYEESGFVFYKTRGDNGDNDNNPETVASIDPNPVAANDIIGKWTETRLAGVGNIMSFLQSQTGFLTVIVLPLILFFLYELTRFIRALIKAKGKSKLSTEEEEEIKKRAIEEYLRQQQLADKSGSEAEKTESIPENEENNENTENNDKN
ncbi:MAG: signal peptidase I [Eubacteriales bacterium]|nr:signal peptidase I [Eubacteriales bacterium]